MSDQSIGDLMELWELRFGGGFDFLKCQPCFRQIQCTFPAERVDALFFHFQVKEQSVG